MVPGLGNQLQSHANLRVFLRQLHHLRNYTSAELVRAALPQETPLALVSRTLPQPSPAPDAWCA